MRCWLLAGRNKERLSCVGSLLFTHIDLCTMLSRGQSRGLSPDEAGDSRQRARVCENIVGINMPRIASAEFKLKDVTSRINALESRIDRLGPQGVHDIQPMVMASHRGAGTEPSAAPVRQISIQTMEQHV